ncbi:MAG TPA: DinB family protein [Acidimicrobiales bacterium]|nr:DinB family protein [Acidimicrobiales bacterium]
MTDAPAPIPPDDKDWTWVLERPCPECGFDAGSLDVTRVGDELRANASAWQRVLARSDVRARPAPTTWSPLEYACHVRDVFRLFLARLDRMLTEDGPHYENWDQDVTAVEERYHEQAPAAVAAELTKAAAALAERWDTVEGDQWSRTGHRSDGAAFTVDSFARYLLHDPVHHLWDVGAGQPQGG